MPRPSGAEPRTSHDAHAIESRRWAVRLIVEVLRRRRPLDEAIETSAGSLALSARDRALGHAIAATALRRLGQIEHLLSRYLKKPLPRKSGEAREILIAGAAQILFMRIPAHAAIDTSVEIARLSPDAKHFAGLINAVLRRLAETGVDEETERETRHLNTPDWLCRRWLAAYGEETAREIAEAHLADPPLDISVKKEPAHWADALGGIILPTGTVRIVSPKGRIEDFPGYDEGAWWVQDAAAALPARLLGEVAGLDVLDLCAAPGGKTAQLAAAGVEVTAVDRSPRRLERLKQNLSRLGLSAEILAAKAEEFRRATAFDAVLLDAPCSATGIVRHNPDIPHLKRPEDIASLKSLQAKMLDNAVTLVRPGGLLVYCTCSIEPEEGEEQIETLLRRNTSLARLPVGPAEIGGADHLVTAQGDLRTLPCDVIGPAVGLDGFFAARLRRL